MEVIDDIVKSLTNISGRVFGGFVEDVFPSEKTDPEAPVQEPVDSVQNQENEKDETAPLPSPMQTYTNKVDTKKEEPTVVTEAPKTEVTPQTQEEPQQTDTVSPAPEELPEPVVDMPLPVAQKKGPVPLHAQKNQDGSFDYLFRGPNAAAVKQPGNVALSSKK